MQIHSHRTQLPSRSEIQVSHRPHTQKHKKRISLSPRSTSAISTRYRWIQDHGNRSRDPEPLWELTRGQTKAPASNFDRISPSPQSTSTDHQPHTQHHIHRYGTDPETKSRSTVTKQIHIQGPIHRHRTQLPSRSEIQVSHRPYTEVSHRGAQEENFAKSTIHIGDLSKIQGFWDPGNGFRHSGPQEETQGSGTTGANPEIRNHYKEPATEEPTGRQATAPVPNFGRILPSPR
jgi:hypothetical protein